MKFVLKWALYFTFAIVIVSNLWWHLSSSQREKVYNQLGLEFIGETKSKIFGGSKADVVKRSKSGNIKDLKRSFEEIGLDHGLAVRPHGLPKFGVGEYVLGSLLEREFGSSQLYVTIFLLNRFALRKGRGAEYVNPDYRQAWEGLLFDQEEDNYYTNGVRKTFDKYICRIAHSATSETYYTTAVFVPSRLAYDANENRYVETVRCKMSNSLAAQQMFADTMESVYVELFHKTELVSNFTIPWHNRRAGYLLDQPSGTTTINSWAGYEENSKPIFTTAPSSPLSNTIAIAKRPILVDICVPGMFRVPQGKALHVLLEFITHHLLLGFHHIELAVAFGLESDGMQLFATSLKPFIDEGRLSIVSLSADGIDFVASTTGLSWSRTAAKQLHMATCLYAAKGVADYVAVLDIDEFLVLKDSELTTVNDLIGKHDIHPQDKLEFPIAPGRPLEVLKQSWQGGQGWADTDAHPLCFLQLSSEVLIDRGLDVGGNSHVVNSLNLTLHSSEGPGMFVGRRFVEGTIGPGARAHNRYGYFRSIMPTRRVYQASLISGGACAIDYWPCSKNNERVSRIRRKQLGNHSAAIMNSISTSFTICGDVNMPIKPLGLTLTGMGIDFRDYHSFYEVVRLGDGRKIDSKSSASIYHYKVFGNAGTGFDTALKEGMSTAIYPKLSDNIYSSKYFPNVLKDLEKRGIFEIMTANAAKTFKASNITRKNWVKFHSDAQTDMFLVKLEADRAQVAAELQALKEQAQLAIIPSSTNNTNSNNAINASTATTTVVTSMISNSTNLIRSSTIANQNALSTIDNTTIDSFSNIDQVEYDISDLPNFAVDYSEFILSSLIERTPSSYELHITVFMLCHFILDPIGKEDSTSEGALKVSPIYANAWKRTADSFSKSFLPTANVYSTNGDRNIPFYCKITYDAINYPNQSFIVRGRFVPNRLTPDINSNRRLDILRCPLTEDIAKDRELYELFGKSTNNNNKLKIEILRGNHQNELPDNSNNNLKHIISFLVPWSRRGSGYLMDELVSSIDPWKGVPALNSNPNNDWSEDGIYLAVPGIESALSKKTVALYLEFIQHHINLGVKHIFLSVAFSTKHSQQQQKDSQWDLFLQFLQSYIEEGYVSISSVVDSVDAIEYSYTTKGLHWGRDNVKIFHVNLFTYFAKGLASYVGVWDIDEFFLPRVPILPSSLSASASASASVSAVVVDDIAVAADTDAMPTATVPSHIMDIIDRLTYPNSRYNSIPSSIRTELLQRANYSINATSNTANNNSEYLPLSLSLNWLPSQRGFADGDAHPFCYLLLQSEVVANKISGLDPIDQPHSPWMGQLFSHGSETFSNLRFMKTIRPTRTVFMGGLHTIGACKVEDSWTGCPPTATGTMQYCSKGNTNPRRIMKDPLTQQVHSFHIDHKFDELVTREDGKLIDPINEAIISHIQPYRHWVGASSTALNQSNIYTLFYFQSVIKEIKRRNLFLPITLSDNENTDNKKESFLKHSREVINSNRFDTQLPNWSIDRSQIVLGSILEIDLNHKAIGINIFLLNEQIIRSFKIDKSEILSDSEIENWKAYNESVYDNNSSSSRGSSSDVSASLVYYCKVSVNPQDKEFVLIAAEVVPINSNNNQSTATMQILRCPFPPSADLHKRLMSEGVMENGVATTGRLFIELQSSHLSASASLSASLVNKTVIEFMVRAVDRINSAFIIPPNRQSPIPQSVPSDSAALSNSLSLPEQSIYAWQRGVCTTIATKCALIHSREQLYLLAGDIETFPNRKKLPKLLEFVEHHLHLQQGMSHIFLASPFGWHSQHTADYQSILRGYTHTNGVSISTLSPHQCESQSASMNMSGTTRKASLSPYCLLGKQWPKEVLQSIVRNLWLYWIKGAVTHASVWDIHRFLIPSTTVATAMHPIIVPLLPTSQGSESGISGSSACYATLLQEEVGVAALPYDKNPLSQPTVDWISNVFNASTRASSSNDNTVVIDVNRTAYIGLSASDNACSASDGSSFHAGLLVPHTLGVLYHFNASLQLAIPIVESTTTSVNAISNATAHSNFGTNRYVTDFAPYVLSELKRKRLNLLVAIPYRRLNEPSVLDTWINYRDIYATRNQTLL